MSTETLHIQDVGGSAVGVGLDGDGNIVGEQVTIQGSVIQLVNPSPEAVERLRQVAHMSTEVAVGRAPSTPARPHEVEAMQRQLDEVLRLVKTIHGQAGEVQAGGVHLSRVDLLLRRALLLIGEANRIGIERLGAEAEGADPAAVGEMLAGLDDPQARAKLQEALQALREAAGLDSNHTGVLLHLSQVFGRLSTEETSEERQILEHVRKLLMVPRTDTERLHRAQATYLLGTLGRRRDAERLAEARALFAELGRADWVWQCDAMLVPVAPDPVPVQPVAERREATPPGMDATQTFRRISPLAAVPVPPSTRGSGRKWLLAAVPGTAFVLYTTIYSTGAGASAYADKPDVQQSLSVPGRFAPTNDRAPAVWASDWERLDAGARRLTRADLRGLTDEGLELLRNEIFARRGRRFAREDLQAHFDAQPWYKGGIAPDQFRDDMLSEVERQNVELIRRVQDRRD